MLTKEISNESLDISIESLFAVNKDKIVEKLANQLAKATRFIFKDSGNEYELKGGKVSPN